MYAECVVTNLSYTVCKAASALSCYVGHSCLMLEYSVLPEITRMDRLWMRKCWNYHNGNYLIEFYRWQLSLGKYIITYMIFYIPLCCCKDNWWVTCDLTYLQMTGWEQHKHKTFSSFDLVSLSCFHISGLFRH